MKVFAFTAAMMMFATVSSAQVFNSTLGEGGVEPDIGCIRGALMGSRYPVTTYNPQTHERLTSNISRCTGGYLKGWNEETNARWNADFWDNGSASGRDEAGSRWRYDPSARRFTNLATQKSCATSDLRRVCG